MEHLGEWIIWSKPRPYDDLNTFEVWANGQVRRAKRAGSRSSLLTPGQLYFVDCTHLLQNVICDEARIDAWRIVATPSQAG